MLLLASLIVIAVAALVVAAAIVFRAPGAQGDRGAAQLLGRRPVVALLCLYWLAVATLLLLVWWRGG